MADSKQKIISLQSFNKISGTTDSFVCEINNIDNIHWIQIQDIFILQSHYQIDSSNQLFTFAEGGPNITFNIKNGNFSKSEIEAELKAKLDANGTGPYTVSIDTNNNKMTISRAGNFELKWSLNESLAKTLGFNATNLSGANTYTGQNVINLNRRFGVYNIESLQLSKHHKSVYSSNYRGGLLVRATNANASPQTHFKYTHDDHSNYLMKFDPSERLKYIDIIIRDIDNKPIEFNGADEVIINIIAYIR